MTGIRCCWSLLGTDLAEALRSCAGPGFPTLEHRATSAVTSAVSNAVMCCQTVMAGKQSAVMWYRHRVLPQYPKRLCPCLGAEKPRGSGLPDTRAGPVAAGVKRHHVLSLLLLAVVADTAMGHGQ